MKVIILVELMGICLSEEIVLKPMVEKLSWHRLYGEESSD